MPAKQTASIKPTMTSKRSALTDLDATASTGRLLTVAEAMRWLLRRRDLPAVHVGRICRFRPRDVRHFMNTK